MISGSGSVTTSSYDATYLAGTEVTLTAEPGPGWTVGSPLWSGDVPAGSVNDNPLVVVMDQDRAIHADFVPDGGGDPDPEDPGYVVGWRLWTSGNSHTIPAATQPGDLIIAMATRGGPSGPYTHDTPDGFTKVMEEQGSDPSGWAGVTAAFYKVAEPGDAGSSMSLGGGTGSFPSSSLSVRFVAVIRGASFAAAGGAVEGTDLGWAIGSVAGDQKWILAFSWRTGGSGVTAHGPIVLSPSHTLLVDNVGSDPRSLARGTADSWSMSAADNGAATAILFGAVIGYDL